MAIVPNEGELATRLKERGVATRTIPLPSVRPWNIFQIFSALNDYLRLCRKLRPFLIYSNGPRAALYGGVVGRILGIPVIWHCRIADPDPYLDPLLIRLMSNIVANSQATAQRFSSRFQDKIRVVHNGVDIHWLQDENVQLPQLVQNDWKVILCVARISRWKRHDLVLTAFEMVAEIDSNVHLVCLGSKDEWELEWWAHLQERTRQSPYSERIHWLGRVDDVRPWYRKAYLSVLVSKNEAFGRVIVEAMACGVPVIAVRSGGLPEIIRHQQDGLLVAPGDIEELRTALASLLRDQSIRHRYAKSARERAQHFSLDGHVARMVEVFENTIRH